MGSNIVFAQILVTQMGVSWQAGLAMVLLNAVIFMALSLTRWRAQIVASFPEPIKVGMQCSIGVFVGYLGLKNGGLIASDAAGSIGFGNLADPVVLLTTSAIVLTPLLVVLRVPGALLLSIIAVTVVGLFLNGPHGAKLTQAPASWFALPSLTSNLMFALDFRQFFHKFWPLLPITLYFLLSEFFAGTTTLLSVCRRAGLIDSSGQIPRARAAFASDAFASVVGAAVGTSTVTAFAESVTGVEAGGRTGLVGVVVALLFALSLLFAPLIAAVPIQATAPALVLVGVLMMEGLCGIDTRRPEDSMPPLVMTIVTACTADLMVGLAIGSFIYTAILVGKRDWSKLRPALLLLDAVLVFYLALRGWVLR
jgi:AGZA family xanthine/uracil permease-like MFS transporter